MYQWATICMNGQINLGTISVRRYFGSIAVVTGLLFALISDFPADVGQAALHLLQWQAQTIIPIVILYLVQSLLTRLAAFESLNPWVQLTLTAIAASTLFVPVLLGIDVMFKNDNERFTLTELADEYFAVMPSVIVCWLAINAPWVIGYRLVRDEPLQTKKSQLDFEPEFYSLLSSQMRSDLIYMVAELHYISVITTSGKSMILYNLRDAIAELPASSGLQTHRSYWVALKHIQNFKRSGRQGTLFVSNGDTIPVSRRNLSHVEEAYSAFKNNP